MIFLFRSVRLNFQYAVDILCGSLNRACDAKRLFHFMGLENTQAPIKIDFVFLNESEHYDRELNRNFQSSQLKMFSCDNEVILPHYSGQKCACMVMNEKYRFQ